MNELIFERYELRYQQDVLSLHREAVADLPLDMSLLAEEQDLRDIESSYLTSGGEYLVVLSNDQVVAMGGYKMIDAERAELKRMRVREDYRGKGVGSRLLKELETRASAQGARELMLETAAARPQTLAFYDKHGYDETGRGLYANIETVTFRKLIDPHGDLLGLEASAVRLRGSSARWRELYEEEATRIRAVLGNLIVDIQHFGSTSIPGVKAKPIIDILVGVARLADGEQCIPLLESIGYEYVPETGIPGDFTFGKRARRTHLVHVVEFGSINWRGNLKFRDALRADPALAVIYERLKLSLSEQFQDRASYTAGKSEFILEVVSPIDQDDTDG